MCVFIELNMIILINDVIEEIKKIEIDIFVVDYCEKLNQMGKY